MNYLKLKLNKFIIYFFTTVLTFFLPVWAQNVPQLNLPREVLTIKDKKINTQLAFTNSQQSIGLMFRENMPEDEGMLFVFEEPKTQCFWMKNTLLPLTAAFINDYGVIINLEDMQPKTLNPHCSKSPVRFVLEMNQGWFSKNNIKPGMKFNGVMFNK